MTCTLVQRAGIKASRDLRLRSRRSNRHIRFDGLVDISLCQFESNGRPVRAERPRAVHYRRVEAKWRRDPYSTNTSTGVLTDPLQPLGSLVVVLLPTHPSECSILRLAGLTQCKDDYLPERDPWFRRISLSLRQTVQWGVRICARYFRAISGSEGAGRNGDKPFGASHRLRKKRMYFRRPKRGY